MTWSQSGLSLEIVRHLLEHTQAATTKRDAHLHDDPLRAATERFGAMVTGAGEAKPVQVVDLHGRRV